MLLLLMIRRSGAATKTKNSDQLRSMHSRRVAAADYSGGHKMWLLDRIVPRTKWMEREED